MGVHEAAGLYSPYFGNGWPKAFVMCHHDINSNRVPFGQTCTTPHKIYSKSSSWKVAGIKLGIIKRVFLLVARARDLHTEKETRITFESSLIHSRNKYLTNDYYTSTADYTPHH